MNRRNFLLTLLFGIPAYIIGYKIKRNIDVKVVENDYKISVTGDGITSDSANIQNSIKRGVSLGYKNFILPPNVTCFIDSTIVLPSDISINGQGTILKAKKYTDVGRYTTCIFTATNQSNLTLKNITFDGNSGNTGYIDTTDGTKLGNLVKFDSVRNLTFENCKFTRFLSNVNSLSPDPYKSGYWAVMFVKSCENVKLISCHITESAIEGWFFWECENILIDKCKTENRYMSTPISLLFCNGFNLINNNILEDVNRGKNAGSVLNIYSKNGLINGNYIKGGTSLDVGNETEKYSEIPFVQDNLTISNNYINTSINAIYNDKTKHLNRNVNIFNNTIDTTGFNYGVRLGNVDKANIYNNDIIGAVSGIRIFRDDFSYVKIYSNTFIDVKRGIDFTIDNNSISNVEIVNNQVMVKDVSSNGKVFSFITFKRQNITKRKEVIKNIRVENNVVECPANWVWVEYVNITPISVKGFSLEGNILEK